ncbi:MAG TPA: hypothetical protein VH231_03275 [Solirubrobacteraceae bacterium]|jgi:hypothetical protein|nr:hypothetical protein [Solirubrobacteraceae bacterium]
MTDPDFAQDRYVQLRGRAWHQWLRRGLLLAMLAVLVAALFNLFGQKTASTAVTTTQARLRVESPPRLSGGVLFQARFRLQALGHAVDHPKLVLGENWYDGMTLNSTTPNPTSENSRGGRFALAFPELGRGQTLTVITEWQVNPTALGRRSMDVFFDDGNKRLAAVHRTLTIFP